jgi:ABC-type transport system involved in multi-copper enzyme maturation permease subunit
MIRSMHAELLKLRRPAFVYGASGAMLGFAVLATVLTFATATATPAGSWVGGDTLTSTVDQLGQVGGLTRGFTIAAGFIGLLVFVLFASDLTSEYGLGTIRVLLLKEPRRARLLAGKLLALLVCVAAVLLAAELLAGAVAVALAHLRGIPTADWFTVAGLRALVGDYVNALLAAGLFGAVGAAVGVLARSTSLALGIGLAWLAPLEHLIQLSWSGAGDWLPGLVFDAVAGGGTSTTTYAHAVVTALLYAALALTAGTVVFVRRDVSV